MAPIASMDAAAVLGRASQELDSACGLFQQRLDLGHLGNDCGGLLDPFAVELDHGVPVLQHFAGLKVADPVVWEPRSHEGHVPGLERADVVSDDEFSGALPDQVDLVLGMVVPACQRAGVVVLVPPD